MDRDDLTRLFRKVLSYGSAEVPTRYLLWWFGRERLTKAVWKAITEAWQSFCEDLGYDEEMIPRLLVGYAKEVEIYTFVWGGEFGDDGELQAWLKPIGDLTQGNKDDEEE